MNQTIGKCRNAACSQFDLEKNFGVVLLYGYAQGSWPVCPECETLIVPSADTGEHTDQFSQPRL